MGRRSCSCNASNSCHCRCRLSRWNGGRGATSSALTGGNIGQGALIGFVAGGIGGYVGSINFNSPYLEGLAQIGTGALVGGTTSELTGGKFGEGFGLGAVSGTVAFATNRILEAKRFGPKIHEEQTTEVLKVAKEAGWSESILESSPTEEFGLPKGSYERIEKTYKPFNSEIDHIRTHGSCPDCGNNGQLRFGNYHVLKHANGRITIHYDRFDVVKQPFEHIIRDWWLNR